MIIKVCGMREPDNIRAVEQLGIDWMGFVFCPQSPRYVRTVPTYLPSHCKRVGVFVDAKIAEVLNRTRDYQLDVVQLHGEESPHYIEHLLAVLPARVQIMKMLPVATVKDLRRTEVYAPLVNYFLFETKFLQTGNYYGGSGKQFDWNILSAYQGTKSFLLSGGIGPDDAERLHTFFSSDNGSVAEKCIGIDLNSRFEISPALKDVSVLQKFRSKLPH